MKLDKDIKRVMIVLGMLIFLVLSGLYGVASHLENNRLDAIEKKKTTEYQQSFFKQLKPRKDYNGNLP